MSEDTKSVLTEQQVLNCLVKAGCLDTVKLTYDSGPYEVTRPTGNAYRLVKAIEQEHGIERLQAKVREQAERLTDSETAMMKCWAERHKLHAENAELRAKFTKTDQPKYSGDPMLDKWLETRNPEFTAEIEKLPPTYWARYDLSAVRIGWELAKRQEEAKRHGESE